MSTTLAPSGPDGDAMGGSRESATCRRGSNVRALAPNVNVTSPRDHEAHLLLVMLVARNRDVRLELDQGHRDPLTSTTRPRTPSQTCWNSNSSIARRFEPGSLLMRAPVRGTRWFGSAAAEVVDVGLRRHKRNRAHATRRQAEAFEEHPQPEARYSGSGGCRGGRLVVGPDLEQRSDALDRGRSDRANPFAKAITNAIASTSKCVRRRGVSS